jgi:predicted transglutaminase-like cysteine proteinase
MRGLHAGRAALLLAAVTLVSGHMAAADEIEAAEAGPAGISQHAVLTEFESARMPSGLAELCLREPVYCAEVNPVAAPLDLSPEERIMVERINVEVNHAIESTTDEELYGRREYWTLPTTAGDCEDYVLLKRKLLAENGMPLGSLLITVVHDEYGEAHAVLSIPTTQGDLVLDNRRDEVLAWRETGYSFIKRQSAAYPSRWVALSRGELQATDIASAPEAPSAQQQ